jgi:hypothetical protein
MGPSGCLWTFANVSRMVDILNGVTPDETIVRSGPLGCTHSMYNIRHELDPCTWYKTYEPAIEHGRNFVNNVVRIKNTHSFQEYVADPHQSLAQTAKAAVAQDGRMLT